MLYLNKLAFYVDCLKARSYIHQDAIYHMFASTKWYGHYPDRMKDYERPFRDMYREVNNSIYPVMHNADKSVLVQFVKKDQIEYFKLIYCNYTWEKCRYGGYNERVHEVKTRLIYPNRTPQNHLIYQKILKEYRQFLIKPCLTF